MILGASRMKVGDLVRDTIDGNLNIIIGHNKATTSKDYCWQVYDLVGGFVWDADDDELEKVR